MNNSVLVLQLLLLSVVGCAPLSNQVATDVAPRVRTDVAVQVGTEVAVRLENIANPGSAPTTAELVTYYVISDGRVNIRACPATSCEVIGRVAYGERIQVADDLGEWLELRLEDGRAGFMAGWLAGKDAPAINKPQAPVEPESPASIETEAPFDCEAKTCGKMESCAEAVYKLYVCGDTARDSNYDGIPCESLCKGTDVSAIATSYAGISPTAAPTLPPGAAEMGPVTRVVDGDTIDVMLNGVNTRIRYLQMNTPERDHPCFKDSTQANAALVMGKTVRLVADKELVDRYDRLLRFVYVDDVLVNRVLVKQGWAEVVLYPPNDMHYDEFLQLERKAAAAGRGCHPSGVFDDGSSTR